MTKTCSNNKASKDPVARGLSIVATLGAIISAIYTYNNYQSAEMQRLFVLNKIDFALRLSKEGTLTISQSDGTDTNLKKIQLLATFLDFDNAGTPVPIPGRIVDLPLDGKQTGRAPNSYEILQIQRVICDKQKPEIFKTSCEKSKITELYAFYRIGDVNKKTSVHIAGG